jgi:hypothetical protein
VTDEAVESLKLGYGHLHKTLQLFYLAGKGIKETARVMERAESTIKAQLERADALLAVWFAERKRRKEPRPQSYGPRWRRGGRPSSTVLLLDRTGTFQASCAVRVSRGFAAQARAFPGFRFSGAPRHEAAGHDQHLGRREGAGGCSA